MTRPDTDAETTFVQNNTPGPIDVNLSTYDDESGEVEERDRVRFVAREVKHDDELRPGVTPIDKDILRHIREDDRLARRFATGDLTEVQSGRIIT